MTPTQKIEALARMEGWGNLHQEVLDCVLGAELCGHHPETEDLARRQKKHIEDLQSKQNWQPCMHNNCPECSGTGIRRNGGSCVHMISCPCPKCSPASLNL